MTTNAKLWSAWAADCSRDLPLFETAGALTMAAAGSACGLKVPRLLRPGIMTEALAQSLLPTLTSRSVTAIHAAALEAARQIPGDDALDTELLIAVLRARDFLLDQRDALARAIAMTHGGRGA